MKKVDLTEGRVLKVLTTLALPIMGSSFLQFTYNLIDMLWVGKLGSDAISSIGSSSFFIGIGYAINSLVVIGTGIKVAHAAGEKNEKEAREYINSGIFINLIIALIFSLILIFMGRNFISFLHLNNHNVEKNAYEYLAANSVVLFLAFFNLLYARILGAFGNNKLAFKINSIGIIINIVFDPIFIYVFNMGVVGAAIATLLANIVMMILYLKKSGGILKFNFKLKLDKQKQKEIFKLGFPMASQRVLFTLINIFIARIIAIFGAEAIAAQKIGVQIESITYMVIGGLHGAVSSFVGQNFGAKKYLRIKEGYRESLKIGFIYSFSLSIIFLFFSVPLVKLFVTENETVIIAKSYLQIMAVSQIFSTIETVTNGFFTGLGNSKIPASISIIFTLIRIPLALILIKPFGINGVWMSISLSSIIKGIVAFIFYKREIKYKLLIN